MCTCKSLKLVKEFPINPESLATFKRKLKTDFFETILLISTELSATAIRCLHRHMTHYSSSTTTTTATTTTTYLLLKLQCT